MRGNLCSDAAISAILYLELIIRVGDSEIPESSRASICITTQQDQHLTRYTYYLISMMFNKLAFLNIKYKMAWIFTFIAHFVCISCVYQQRYRHISFS